MRIPTLRGIKNAFYLSAVARKTDDEISRVLFRDVLMEQRDVDLTATMLERFGDKINADNFHLAFVCAASIGLYERYSIILKDTPDTDAVHRFYTLAKAHPFAADVSAHHIATVLEDAAHARDMTLFNLVLSFPQSGQMSDYDLRRPLLYTLPAGHPDIKRIEPRKMNFDFGDGAPAMEAEIRTRMAAAQAREAASPTSFTL